MARKLKKIIVPDEHGNLVEYGVGGVDASNASEGQVLTADGNGGTIWGDADAGGNSVPTEVRQALFNLLNNNAFANDDTYTADLAVIEAWANVATAITVSPSTASISGSGTRQLTAVTTPAGASVFWASSNTSVATVSSSGLVTGVGNGTCTITAISGSVSATCAVTVSGFANLVSISAIYTQSGTVYDTDTLDSLKSDLAVTALYDDSTTQTVTSYTLSGTLTEGASVITVSYGGKTTTFNVIVSAPKSDMNNWVDGIAYTDLEIVDNEYIKSGTGEYASYSGWSRTGFVYCEGATSITFPLMAETGTNPPTSNAFYSDKATNTRIQNFALSKTESVTITVPANAKYFGISSETTALNGCVGAGIVPHA